MTPKPALPKAVEMTSRILGVTALAFLATAVLITAMSILFQVAGNPFPVILIRVMRASWCFSASAGTAWWALPTVFVGETGASGYVIRRAEHPVQFWFSVVSEWVFPIMFLALGIVGFLMAP